MWGPRLQHQLLSQKKPQLSRLICRPPSGKPFEELLTYSILNRQNLCFSPSSSESSPKGRPPLSCNPWSSCMPKPIEDFSSPQNLKHPRYALGKWSKDADGPVDGTREFKSHVAFLCTDSVVWLSGGSDCLTRYSTLQGYQGMANRMWRLKLSCVILKHMSVRSCVSWNADILGEITGDLNVVILGFSGGFVSL
jgi:hypothetical protein